MTPKGREYEKSLHDGEDSDGKCDDIVIEETDGKEADQSAQGKVSEAVVSQQEISHDQNTLVKGIQSDRQSDL